MKRQKKKINRFKEKFGICEIVYKVILEDHQFNKTGKHGTFEADGQVSSRAPGECLPEGPFVYTAAKLQEHTVHPEIRAGQASA